MPLSSPEEFARLGKHLEEIDAVFQQFIAESGYSDNSGTLGRYPHWSAVLRGTVCRKIDLQMEDNSDGQRFEEFFPEIPYRLWAGAWLDDGDTRFGWSPQRGANGVLIFEQCPFSKVKSVLLDSLRQGVCRVQPITESSLREFGSRSKLRTS